MLADLLAVFLLLGRPGGGEKPPPPEALRIESNVVVVFRDVSAAIFMPVSGAAGKPGVGAGAIAGGVVSLAGGLASLAAFSDFEHAVKRTTATTVFQGCHLDRMRLLLLCPGIKCPDSSGEVPNVRPNGARCKRFEH